MDYLSRLGLESDSFEVQVEMKGASALNYAAEHPLDLVILDLKLPDINGYEVAKELRRLYHPWVLPLLMLTGMDRPADQLRGFAHGADAYLTKPYEPDELKRTIGLLLGETAMQSGEAAAPTPRPFHASPREQLRGPTRFPGQALFVAATAMPIQRG